MERNKLRQFPLPTNNWQKPSGNHKMPWTNLWLIRREGEKDTKQQTNRREPIYYFQDHVSIADIGMTVSFW
jgi:hypothetical protein